MNDVTQILEAVRQGDPKAAEELLPLVYGELRRLAAAKMAHEAAGHTLQPTALVHEAWLRLAGGQSQEWEGRAHFFAAAPSTRLSTLAEADLTTLAAQRRIEPRKLTGQLRGDLDWIVMKCLEKERSRRYETAKRTCVGGSGATSGNNAGAMTCPRWMRRPMDGTTWPHSSRMDARWLLPA